MFQSDAYQFLTDVSASEVVLIRLNYLFCFFYLINNLIDNFSLLAYKLTVGDKDE